MGCNVSKEEDTKPVPEPKQPEAQALAPAVPTAGLLETTTPTTLGAPPKPPAMPPTVEHAAERAAQLKRLATLPEHLQLGVTRGLDATQFRFLGSLSFLAARVALLSLLPGPRSLDRLRERHGTARAVP